MVSERRRSRLRQGVQEELIKYFCGGVTARAAAEISGVNRNTAILFYHKLREVIFEALAAEAPELLAGEIEVDESYFGGHRKGRLAAFDRLSPSGRLHDFRNCADPRDCLTTLPSNLTPVKGWKGVLTDAGNGGLVGMDARPKL